MEPQKPIVELRDLHLTLGSLAGEVNILRGISLTIGEGETVSIVGPSGSGKTSLIMVMAGLEAPTSGTVEVAGHSIGGMTEDELALFRRDSLGIVFQNFHLIPTMTALENVAVPLELSGRKDAMERARERLDAVGLGHRLSHYPGQLSGGEQQRVALARAFAGEPALILADEPTGNLDGSTGRQIIDLMFDLTDRIGTTLILITHDPALAERCSRTIGIEDGIIASDNAPTGPKVGAAGAIDTEHGGKARVGLGRGTPA